ncbi:MAG: Flp pilus assembly protein CpaB [Chloroflexi bacterium]|nr:Flp pilus assembly protein CpaB [Chloroflexota bacterium]
MRLRTFLLLFIVIALIAVAGVLAYVRFFGGNADSSITDGVTAPIGDQSGDDASTGEPGLPPPTATPATRYINVVVTTRNLPIGTVIRPELLSFETRPDSNIALQGGYVFTDPEELIGRIVKTEIAEGEAILAPMLALSTTDLAAFGSDLALYVDQGKVAVAFPINRYTGAAYAMRPGDIVDVLMSLPIVTLDPEYNTKLPNVTQRVDDLGLAEGRSFLFPEALEGRLELIDQLEMVGEVSGPISSQEGSKSTQVQRRATQLTIQQATVLWVGTWRDPRDLAREAAAAAAAAELAAASSDIPVPTPTPLPDRLDATPDVVILIMPAQDALALKWSLERGIAISLVLRSPGDETTFSTVTVSLPQLVEQGALRIPERSEYDIEPSMRDREFPRLDQPESP